MSELQSNRRRQAQRELGLTDEHEQAHGDVRHKES